MQIDDSTFRNLLLETQVLSTKEFPRWDFDILIQLAEGPLLAPKRLDEAMRASKLMRRVLAFLHPLNYQYSAVPRSMVSTPSSQGKSY
jgi:rapamycin-insensitive companion of mTOR